MQNREPISVPPSLKLRWTRQSNEPDVTLHEIRRLWARERITDHGRKGREGRLPRDFAAKNGCRVPGGRSLPYAFRMLHSSNCSALGAVGNSWPVRRLTMFGSGDKQPLLVAGIGYELGFKDPSYFSRFIGRELKTSPAEFSLEA
jgi:AraC-like DNA-binding protein